MALEDLKEKIQSGFKDQWDQFQETPIYIQTKERYENLTPLMQKLSLLGVGLFLTYLIFSLPFSYFGKSSEHISEFEESRQTIRDLLKAAKESQEIPDIAVPPPIDVLKSQIDEQIQAARLLPEQVRGTEILTEKPALIPGNLSQGVVQVSLAKLNLRQVLDLGFLFQSISPSVKMTDMVMDANAQDPRYYDVLFKLAVLAVPSQIEAPAEPEPTKKKGR